MRLGSLEFDEKKVLFYDNTLRDGEQYPGVYFSPEQKARIARLLLEVGVDLLNVGFPAVGEQEREGVRAVLRVFPIERTVALARCKQDDIRLVADLGVPTVSLFFPGSAILRASRPSTVPEEKVDEIVLEAIHYARSLGLNVIFAFEDMMRCDLNWIFERYKQYCPYISAFGITDTVGCAAPWKVGRYVETLKELGKPLILHLHNDLGMATANTIVGLKSGANIAGTTATGIGERAGNASLEEVAVASTLLLDREINIKLERLYDMSLQIQAITGVRLDDLRPLVGKNAFRHESSIHVDALVRNELSYQPISPTTIGRRMEFTLGKHSGRRGIVAFHRLYGLEETEESLRLTEQIIRRSIGSGYRDITERVLRAHGRSPRETTNQ